MKLFPVSVSYNGLRDPPARETSLPIFADAVISLALDTGIEEIPPHLPPKNEDGLPSSRTGFQADSTA